MKFYNEVQGIMIFLILFTKQNLGMLYIIALTVAEIYVDKKAFIHYMIRECTVTLVLLLISALIMNARGNLAGFINYTIMGMFDFTSNNLTIAEGVEIIIACYGVLALLSYVLSFIVYKGEKNMKSLIIFGLALNLSAFPIFNLYHTSIAILLNIVIFMCIFDKLLLGALKKKKAKVIPAVLTVFLYAGLCAVAIKTFFVSDNLTRITDTDNVYFSAYIDETLQENLVAVTDYISESDKDVICVSSDAALYMTYLGKNNQKYDLLFEGNLGYNGTENLLDELAELDSNTVFLMNKTAYWQEISEVRDYIIAAYKNEGMVGDCYIFTKN